LHPHHTPGRSRPIGPIFTPPPDRFPHVPRHVAEHVWGAGNVPESWERMYHEPRVPRSAIVAGAGAASGGAALAFPLGLAGDGLSMAGHVATVVPLGMIGRALVVLAVLAAIARVGVALARWGAREGRSDLYEALTDLVAR